MNIITDNKSLEKFCKSLNTREFVTIDTEFVRERTFFPVLCLIQIGTSRKSAVIDVMADITDYSPLKEVLINEKVIKVLHSARQDIEALYQLLNIIPSPLFDTQIAAMALGFGDSVSYQSLVSHFCKVSISKGQRLTDWTKRPLNEKQLEYAISDVTYLIKIYKEILKMLDDSERKEWIEEEHDALIDEENYKIDVTKAWERLKPRNETKEYISRLKELVAFRDSLAISVDKPRKFVMSDESLLEIALLNPKNEEELASIRSVQRKSNGSIKYKEEIFISLKNANPQTVEIPKRPSKDFMSKVIKRKPLIDMLRLFLGIKCFEEKVSSKLVASGTDIDEIAVSGKNAKSKALKGWRFAFFGKEALLLKDGKLTLFYDKEKNKIVAMEKL